jgi:cytochrome c peroxidase
LISIFNKATVPVMPRFTPVALTAPLALALLGGCDGPKESPLSPKEMLGLELFQDTSLSSPEGQACSSCHDANFAFTGNDGSSIAAVARGSRPTEHGGRNVPTAMYASYAPPFAFVRDVDEHGVARRIAQGGAFWDGRARTLVDQAKGPFLNPREMNMESAAAVVAKVKAARYASLFRLVYGDDALDDATSAYDRVAEAIAAYEGTSTFHPFSSRFDDFLRGEGALEDDEMRGLDLFSDPEKGNCISCHAGTVGSRNPEDWLFTDFTYDALGLPRNRALPDNTDPKHFDLGLCEQDGLDAHLPAGMDKARLCGAFKVPTLRNVELTAPYGHNGVFTELRDVVRFYALRDTNPELFYPPGPDGAPAKFDDLPAAYRGNVNTREVPYDRKPGDAPRLSDDEIDAIVAFLRTLTDR